MTAAALAFYKRKKWPPAASYNAHQVHQAGTFAQALHESLRWLSSHARLREPPAEQKTKTQSEWIPVTTRGTHTCTHTHMRARTRVEQVVARLFSRPKFGNGATARWNDDESRPLCVGRTASIRRIPKGRRDIAGRSKGSKGSRGSREGLGLRCGATTRNTGTQAETGVACSMFLGFICKDGLLEME